VSAEGRNLYLVWLWIVFLLAVAITPVIVLAYRLLIVPRRREEIWTSLSKDAREAYRRLFAPEEERGADRALNDAFDATHGGWRYVGACIPMIVATAAAVGACLLAVDARLQGSHARAPAFIVIQEPAIFALAGAFVWSVYEVLSRVGSRDLGPDTLMQITLRYLAAVPIGWALSLIAAGQVVNTFAFASTVFPLRELRNFIRRWFAKKVGLESTPPQSRAVVGEVAVTLDGVGEDAAARLLELEYATALDLAYADPVRLMARTGRSLRLVLSWIDQALLFVYAPGLKTSLARWGVPCALDASEFYEHHFFDPASKASRAYTNDAYVAALAKRVDADAEILGQIFGNVWRDPHVSFLRVVWYLDAARDPTPMLPPGKAP
jgi:hypothetical protein